MSRNQSSAPDQSTKEGRACLFYRLLLLVSLLCLLFPLSSCLLAVLDMKVAIKPARSFCLLDRSIKEGNNFSFFCPSLYTPSFTCISSHFPLCLLSALSFLFLFLFLFLLSASVQHRLSRMVEKDLTGFDLFHTLLLQFLQAAPFAQVKEMYAEERKGEGRERTSTVGAMARTEETERKTRGRNGFDLFRLCFFSSFSVLHLHK